jgi:hypothetical protein
MARPCGSPLCENASAKVPLELLTGHDSHKVFRLNRKLARAINRLDGGVAIVWPAEMPATWQ